VVAQAGAQDRSSHRRPIAGGPHAAARWRKAEPEFQDRPQGCPADTGRHAEQPEAESPGQDTSEALDVGRGIQKRLAYETSMFGIVADQSATQDETMP